ncbi:MAG: DUF2797 domain-containing protein [Oligoflexia bacterium]|nr:DUF2797 domain-containing protein [Oligoflexia bacterium]
MQIEGNLLKMKTSLVDGKANYLLPLKEKGSEEYTEHPIEEYIGKNIQINFDGQINDIYDNKIIKKSYGQGFSYKNFITLARCDSCIVKPELCHFEEGTCREPKWGEENCFIDHVIYLSLTSGAKIGITRNTQVPYRWMDQGAHQALPILSVPDRKTSGIIESEIAKDFNDKTNWRKMLKSDCEEVDLYELRETIFDQYADLLDEMGAEDLDEEIIHIEYPVTATPEKITSFGLDKKPEISGKLLGIKGQYLIMDTGVINLRKHQGYYIRMTIS